MNQRIGYARVFKDDQHLNLQRDALLRAGHAFVVWRLNRIGRRLSDLVQIVADLEWKRASFESLTGNVETRSGTGMLVFDVFAVLAEFERTVSRERSQSDLAAARARGRVSGRKPKLDDQDVREIKALLHDPGIQVADVARRYGVSRTTIYKHCSVVSPNIRSTHTMSIEESYSINSPRRLRCVANELSRNINSSSLGRSGYSIGRVRSFDEYMRWHQQLGRTVRRPTLDKRTAALERT